MQYNQRHRFWIQKFKSDPQNLNVKFKSIFKGNLPFEIDDDIFDRVELEEFVKIEQNRIPLFLGSQFGIAPRINELPEFFNGEKIIAILAKSMLSGHVSGLTMYKIHENEKQFHPHKIEFYSNYKPF
jgi:hypothetical protein